MDNVDSVDITVRPDSKGRISLGRLANGISSFKISRAGEKLILEPYVEIPAREQWLYKNPEAFNSVKQGLAEVKTHKPKFNGSFKEYLDQDID